MYSCYIYQVLEVCPILGIHKANALLESNAKIGKLPEALRDACIEQMSFKMMRPPTGAVDN
jgi:hypothetical protein